MRLKELLNYNVHFITGTGLNMRISLRLRFKLIWNNRGVHDRSLSLFWLTGWRKTVVLLYGWMGWRERIENFERVSKSGRGLKVLIQKGLWSNVSTRVPWGGFVLWPPPTLISHMLAFLEACQFLYPCSRLISSFTRRKGALFDVQTR